MLIKNNDTKETYLVYGFFGIDESLRYITYEDEYSPLNFMSSDDCEIIDNTYSKYWIKYDENTFMPQGWNETNFLYELVDDLEPLENTTFKKAKENIDKEFSYYKLNASEEFVEIDAEAIGDHWVLCPECNEAFEVNSESKVIKCTGCYIELNNPYYKITS